MLTEPELLQPRDSKEKERAFIYKAKLFLEAVSSRFPRQQTTAFEPGRRRELEKSSSKERPFIREKCDLNANFSRGAFENSSTREEDARGVFKVVDASSEIMKIDAQQSSAEREKDEFPANIRALSYRDQGLKANSLGVVPTRELGEREETRAVPFFRSFKAISINSARNRRGKKAHRDET